MISFDDLLFQNYLTLLKINNIELRFFSQISLVNGKLMMMMNCFYGMVDRRKAFSLISSRDHCQRLSPSRISDSPRTGFEPAHNLSSGFVE